MPSHSDTRTWPELAIGLYDKLTERNAKIDYRFTDFEIGVPSSTNGEAKHAHWKINGTLEITTSNGAES